MPHVLTTVCLLPGLCSALSRQSEPVFRVLCSWAASPKHAWLSKHLNKRITKVRLPVTCVRMKCDQNHKYLTKQKELYTGVKKEVQTDFRAEEASVGP